MINYEYGGYLSTGREMNSENFNLSKWTFEGEYPGKNNFNDISIRWMWRGYEFTSLKGIKIEWFVLEIPSKIILKAYLTSLIRFFIDHKVITN